MSEETQIMKCMTCNKKITDFEIFTSYRNGKQTTREIYCCKHFIKNVIERTLKTLINHPELQTDKEIAKLVEIFKKEYIL